MDFSEIWDECISRLLEWIFNNNNFTLTTPHLSYTLLLAYKTPPHSHIPFSLIPTITPTSHYSPLTSPRTSSLIIPSHPHHRSYLTPHITPHLHSLVPHLSPFPLTIPSHPHHHSYLSSNTPPCHLLTPHLSPLPLIPSQRLHV